jgi:hypothetical protein
MLNPDRMDTTIPVPALVLGLAGLIPFVGLPLMVAAGFGTEGIGAVVTYGAVILSFMGGVQWGLAMRAPPSVGSTWVYFAASVVPALVAWVTLMLTDQPALITLASAFALLLAYDVWTIRRGLGPQWYPTLRLMLTAVVVTSLCATAAFLL